MADAEFSTQTAADLVALSDYVFQRTRRRVDGLTDAEYLWEPVPGCWTIRPRDDGTYRRDFVMPYPEPEPFTTLAWRLVHLIDCYAADRNATWIGVEPQPWEGPTDGVLDGTAASALGRLDAAHDRWRAHLTALAPDELTTLMGPIAGPYAEYTRASLVLHQLDEMVHHGAEIALIRDLYAAQRDADRPAPLTRVLAGDESAVDQAKAQHPNLLAAVAGAGRWDVVARLLDAGERDEPTEGIIPAIHLAAGAGELGIVRRLVASGADLAVKDPTWSETPLGWARYMNKGDVAEYLSSL